MPFPMSLFLTQSGATCYVSGLDVGFGEWSWSRRISDLHRGSQTAVVGGPRVMVLQPQAAAV